MAPVSRRITFDKLPTNRVLHYHTILNVAPFPYMPDPWDDNNNHLLQFIQAEFNAVHPGIFLILRPMNTMDDFYNIAQ